MFLYLSYETRKLVHSMHKFWAPWIKVPMPKYTQIILVSEVAILLPSCIFYIMLHLHLCLHGCAMDKREAIPMRTSTHNDYLETWQSVFFIFLL